MRLVASLAVFQYHLWNNYLGVTFIHPGTDFFIVLVGMVAALSEANRISQGEWKEYILGRYLRLYTTFVPVYLLYILAGQDELTPEYLVKSFFFIPLPGDLLPLVGPTWMLSLFLIFYWLFSVSFIAQREAVLLPIFTLWGIGCTAAWGLNLHITVFDEGFQTLFNLRNLSFIAGYGAGWLVRTGRISGALGKHLTRIGVLILGAGAILLNSIPYNIGLRVLIYGIGMTFFASGLASQEKDGVETTTLRLFTHPWFVWLGGASYVLYLTHNMILGVWNKILPIAVWQIPFIVIVVLIVAGIGYQFWERPVLTHLRRKWLRRW